MSQNTRTLPRFALAHYTWPERMQAWTLAAVLFVGAFAPSIVTGPS